MPTTQVLLDPKAAEAHISCVLQMELGPGLEAVPQEASKEGESGCLATPRGQVSITPKMVFRTIYAQLSTEASFIQ